MSRIDQLRDFAGEVAPQLLRGWGGVLNEFDQNFPGSPLPGFTGARDSAYRLADLLADTFGEPELDFQPPFEGGQCPGVQYLVTVNVVPGEDDSFGGGETVRGVPGDTAIFGPIRGVVNESTGLTTRALILNFSTFTGEPDSLTLVGGGVSEEASASIVSVQVVGGGADECGDPPPEYVDDPTVPPIGLEPDGELTGDGLPELPDGWIPRLCGVDIGLPCAGISICAGGFRARVGTCGIDVGLDPNANLPPGGGGEQVPSDEISDGPVEGDGSPDEFDVPDDAVAMIVRVLPPFPDNVGFNYVGPSGSDLEGAFGRVWVGSDVDGVGEISWVTQIFLQRQANLIPLPTGLTDRKLSVRVEPGVRFQVFDSGERPCPCCGCSEEVF